MTSIRQQKKKAAKLAAKNAKKAAAPNDGDDIAENEVPEAAENEAPGQTSQFAKEPLAGIAPEGSDIKEPPLQPVKDKKEEAPEDKKPEAKNPQAQQEEETPEQAQARRKKCADFLNETWEIRNIDPLLQEELREAQKKKDRRFGDMIEMTLKNGHKIGCYNNFAGQGYEFIGLAGKKAGPMDEDDARAIIAAAKSRGWESVKIHGSKEDKDKLWLEAMRQGVATGYSPAEGSPVLDKWKKEYEDMIDKSATGVRQEAETAPQTEAAPEAKTEKPAETKPEAQAKDKDKPEDPAEPAASKFMAKPKDEEPAKPAAAAPTEPSFSEYLQEKAEKTRNPAAAAGLMKIKEAHDSGMLQMGVNQTVIFKQKLEGKGYDAAAKFVEQSSNPTNKAGEGLKLPREKDARRQQKHARP